MPRLQRPIPAAATEQGAETNAGPATRDFVDCEGVRWTVHERRFDNRAVGMPRLLARLGYGEGWLTFRAGEAQYRIGPYPPDWQSLSDFELERWCMRARWEARQRAERKQQDRRR